MKKIIVLNKKEGETPLQALSLFRNKHKAYKDVSMTYAGRLDPMASGLLLILAGEETKNREKYLKLDKEYEFQVLFGFATDTYDILGKVTKANTRQDLTEKRGDLEKKIKDNLKLFTGKFIQKYPLYSSKTVAGKALFEYGREGIDVVVPTREVSVKSLKFLSIKKINTQKLLSDIERRVKRVDGDFRQEEILKIWKQNLKVKNEQGDVFLRIARFKIKCGSGTYVRGIAYALGEAIGLPALAFSIKRTKIGKYDKVQ